MTLLQAASSFFVLLIFLATSCSGVPENGGFSLPPRTEKHNLCEFDSVSTNELEVDKFLEVYYEKKPVLIRGGAADWVAQTKWTKEYVLASGFDLFDATSEDFLTQLAGNNAAAAAVVTNKEKNSTLKKHVRSGHYMFRRLENGGKLADILPVLQDIAIPTYFEAAWDLSNANRQIEAKNKPGLDYFLAFSDQQNSGLSFHEHTNAWNGLIWGRKRWFIYTKSSPQPHRSHLYIGREGRERWLSNVLPYESHVYRPKECWQQKGDLIYVPSNAQHAIWNEGETIAVSCNYEKDYTLDTKTRPTPKESCNGNQEQARSKQDPNEFPFEAHRLRVLRDNEDHQQLQEVTQKQVRSEYRQVHVGKDRNVQFTVHVLNSNTTNHCDTPSVHLGFPLAEKENEQIPTKKLGVKFHRVCAANPTKMNVKLSDRDISVFDSNIMTWKVVKGVFTVYVGSSTLVGLHMMETFIVD